MDDIWTMTVRIPREAVADRPMVRHALSVLFGPGEWHELRALPSGRGQVVQADDLDAAFSAVESVADQQVYYSLNPIAAGSDRASKKTVLARRWLLIDVDAVKPKDVSSTEEEKVKAATVARAVLEHLSALGWPAPIMIDSGNGWHLLYRIDLANDVLSQQILKNFLYAVAEKFTSDSGIIDRSTHDAPRISKLPGTMARKGPDTPDRPHRMCRIVYEPEQLEVVPVELLQKLGSTLQEKPSATNGKHDPWTSVVSGGPGLTAYLKRAIESECLRVALAVTDRNTQLNKSAFALGQFAGWPEMNEREAKATLQLAAERAGLLDREIIKTIASGWEAGVKEPRVRPQEPVKQAPKPRTDPNEPLTEGLDEIVTEKVNWLYENRIAPGFISIFAGRTGMGKSFVVCDLVACLSRGDKLPYSNLVHPPMRTLFISEDSPRKVLGPRLLELKAVRHMVRFMKFKAMAAYTIGDTEMLTKAYEESGKPQLVVIDPPANFLGEVDEHRNSEVRAVLFLLIEWLEKHNVSCVMIMHINKQIGKGLDAVERILGSVAWGSSARMTVAFNKDPDNPGQLLCGGTKNNLGEIAETLSFKVVKTDDLAKIEWLGKAKTSMEDAMNAIKKKGRGESAIEWLEERFRERREWPSDELRTMAGEYGLSKNALWEPAVQALPIKKRQRCTVDGKRYWAWIAEEGWPKLNGNLGNLGTCDSKSFQDNNNSIFPKLADIGNLNTNQEPDSQVPTFPDSQIPASEIPWDDDLATVDQRTERRRFKIGTWLRTLLWGNPSPGSYVLKTATGTGFGEAEVVAVARLIGVDVSGETWVYRGF